MEGERVAPSSQSPSFSSFLSQSFLLVARTLSAAISPLAPRQTCSNVTHSSLLNFTLDASLSHSRPSCPSSPNPWTLSHILSPSGPVSSLAFSSLSRLGISMHPPSPLTLPFPLVASPAPAILLVLLYLLLVLLWSRWISRRSLPPLPSDPPALRALVLVHNTFLTALSLYMALGLSFHAFAAGFSVWGNKCTNDHPQLAFFIYLFYISKIYEFMDTVIMLLKRSLRQVSYLHVYHHATICLIWWCLCYRCPVGDTYFSAAFNSWVHVFMYSYYLLAAALGKDEKRRKKYLFWGKYLTMLQMTQFLCFMAQAVFFVIRNRLDPGFAPKGIPMLLFFYSLSLLLFFLDFFVKKHVSGCREGGKSRALQERGARNIQANSQKSAKAE